MRRLLGGCLLASLALALVPAPAQAWSVHPREAVPDTVLSAWTIDLTPQALPTTDLLALPGAAACALGDVTGDGVADLAVVVRTASGAVQLEARAGPGFEEVVWRVSTTLDRVLECAPDLDLDGTLDPIIRTLGETSATAAGAAADEARSIVQQTLDGASGVALVGRVDSQSATGALAGGVAAAQNASSVLLPAAEGALALLQGSASQATAALPVPLPPLGPLPSLDNLSATATQAARLDVLDAAGAVTATIEIDEAGVQPLALAPVQLSGALPDVAVLSQVTGPLEQVGAGVPELALYAADGTLAWSTQLPAIAGGLPILVPNAGDLNLDGVGDLIVTTVPEGVQAGAVAAYSVLSGVDGSVLFDSGDAVSGLLSALPLGDLPGGPALLEAALEPAGGALKLSALGANGQVIWSTTVDRLAEPINTVLDPYSGDLLGFTDLTGDGVADVAVASNLTGGGLALQALDGLTGEIAWNVTLPDAQAIVPVVIGAAQVLDLGDANEREDQASSAEGVNRSTEVGELPGLGDAVDGVEDVAVGQASMLLGVGHTATNATLTLLDGVTGQVAWTASADLTGLDVTTLTAEVAGDLTGDQVQDLLITAGLDDPGLDGSAVVAAVSGATGSTVWTDQTTVAASASGGNVTGLEFNGDFGPRASDVEPADSKGAPGVGPMALLVAVVGLAALLRRRRD